MAEEVVLMKGNRSHRPCSHPLRCRRILRLSYYSPIGGIGNSCRTETLGNHRHGGLQAESEVAAINMVYGGAGSGKMVMTSSSSPGVSLKQGRYLYIGRCRTALSDCKRNARRSRTGNHPAEPGRLFPDSKGGGHGDYRLIALAPASVQEMADFVGLAFELAFKYRNPAIILADGVIGQMMEKVVLPKKPRPHGCQKLSSNAHGPLPENQRPQAQYHHFTGTETGRDGKNNIRFQAKYKEIEENEVRFEEIHCEMPNT